MQISSRHYKNYIFGTDTSKWKSNIFSYGEVTYHEFYTNIDLFYNSTNEQLSYNFRVHPNADPDLLKFKLTVSGTNFLVLLQTIVSFISVTKLLYISCGVPFDILVIII